jgi:hypothetical protein
MGLLIKVWGNDGLGTARLMPVEVDGWPVIQRIDGIAVTDADVQRWLAMLAMLALRPFRSSPACLDN